MDRDSNGPRERERQALLRSMEAAIDREVLEAIEIAFRVSEDEADLEITISHGGSDDAHAS